MWYWYERAQELANERYAEARQSRLGRLARSARVVHRTDETVPTGRRLSRRDSTIG